MSANWETAPLLSDNFKISEQLDKIKHHTVTGDDLNIRRYGDDDIVGLDEKRFNVTKTKIKLLEDKLNAMFRDLSESVEDISYFNCAATSSLSKLINDVSINIPIIKNNIASYIKDLNIVNKDYTMIDLQNVAIIKKASNSLPDIDAYQETKEG